MKKAEQQERYRIQSNARVMIEYPPTCRHIYTLDRKDPYYLSLPFMQVWEPFYITFSKQSKIDNPTEKIFHPCLPEVDSNCSGNVGCAYHQVGLKYFKEDDKFKIKDRKHFTNSEIEEYVISPMKKNISLLWSLRHSNLALVLDRTPIRTLLKWEKLSRENPSFILDIDWPQEVIIPPIITSGSREKVW